MNRMVGPDRSIIAEELYKQAIEEGVPFNMYYDWICGKIAN